MATALTAFAVALVISTITTPVGVSGAIFLLPIELSVLRVPSPAVTPTNLLYNVVATPGALLRFSAAAGFDRALIRLLLFGAVPGVMLGAWLRVYHLPGEAVVRVLLVVVLLPLGVWLVATPRRDQGASAAEALRPGAIVVLSASIGIVAGMLGIGGGSIIAPVLAALGLSMRRVAPAALFTTFVTLVVGVLVFLVLSRTGRPEASPDWIIGIALGTGGLVGGYVGARLQPRLPEAFLRRGLGVVAILIGCAYAVVSISATR